MNRLLQRTSGLLRIFHLAVATGIVLGGGALAGCGSVATPPVDVNDPAAPVEPLTVASNIDTLDLLLMIDNSRSMADKQQILAAAVPDLVGTLLNPECIDAAGAPTQPRPSGPLEACPSGAHRAYSPITDIHVGIVTSSLGGHGADTCSVAGDTQSCNGAPNPSNDDAGHLITRQTSCGGKTVPTYGDKGFLAWDPAQVLAPPGEGQLGSITVDGHGVVTTVTPGLIPTLKDLVVGVGQIGCGFTSQLESWYRFLVDPEPYQTISVQDGKAVPQGVDAALLKQRADFLRPGSLVSIVMLTDGNDCSIKESGQFYYAAQQQSPTEPGKAFHLPRARKECATNPDDSCCKSCGQAAPNCPVDDTCTASPTLSDAEDPINLRCFDQKRRFGIDFLYPIERYTNALKSPNIPNRAGEMVKNPLFDDLNPNDDYHGTRDPNMVLLTGIVGVPWQDLARDLSDSSKGFRSSNELMMKDGSGLSAWDRILGDPAAHTPPADPHMIESVTPRPGLPGPGSAPGADPIHGHEYTSAGDDLQYACAFDLPAPRDCSVPGVMGCDCGPGNDNPLCDVTTPTLQLRAKAYPGVRELLLLKSLGDQATVGSICPRQLTDTTRADYGYRQAIGAIIDRLSPTIDGQCLPRVLVPDPQGLVPCTIIEARTTATTPSCDASRARRAVKVADQKFLEAIKASPQAKDEGWNSFCELVEAGDPVDSTKEELAACVGDPSEAPIIQGGKDSGTPANGWCYVDPSRSPASNPELVSRCPDTEKRIIRFLGDTLASTSSTLFIACTAQ